MSAVFQLLLTMPDSWKPHSKHCLGGWNCDLEHSIMTQTGHVTKKRDLCWGWGAIGRVHF